MHKKPLFIFLGVFLILILLKLPSLSLPYYWDAMLYTIPGAMEIKENNFNPFASKIVNHTFLMHEILAIIFELTNNSIIAAKLLDLFFAALAIFFTYRLGKHLGNIHTGIISSIILLFTPLFFAQAGLLHQDLAVAAFSLAGIYFFMKEKRFLAAIFLSIAVLIKETAAITAIAIILYQLLKEKLTKENIQKIAKKIAILAIPIYLLAVWALLNLYFHGWLFNPIATNASSNISSLGWLFIFIKILKVVFFDDFRWVLTTIALLSLAIPQWKRTRKSAIILYAFCSFLLIILLLFTSPLAEIINKSGYFKHGGEYISLLQNYSLLFGAWLFLILISIKSIVRFIKEHLLLTLIFLLNTIFFSFFHATERYILLLIPLFLLLSLILIYPLLNKKAYGIAALLVMLSLLVLSPIKPFHGGMEINLEYEQFVLSHRDAAQYLEKNYPEATILVPFNSQQDYELQYSYLGYVKKPVQAVKIKDVKSIKEQDFDVLYHSPFMPQQDKQYLIEKFNLKLEKEFNRKGKITQIYVKSDAGRNI